jgi:hypothetical protein
VSGVRPKPQQRVLGDFFGTLPPIMAAQSPVLNKGSNESFSAPNTAHSLTPEQNCDLTLGAEAQPQVPADKGSAQLPSAIPDDSHTPVETTRIPPRSVNTVQVNMSRLIVLKPALPSSTKLHRVDPRDARSLSSPERCLGSRQCHLAKILSTLES